MRQVFMFLIFCIYFFTLNVSAAEYILKFKKNSSSSAEKSVQMFFASNIFVKKLAYNSTADLFKVEIENDRQAKKIQNTQPELIEFLVPNQIIQIEESLRAPLSRSKISPDVAKQWNLEKIRVGGAWALAGNRGSRKIVVAVIDSGIDGEHPDLKANLVPGYNFFDNNTNTTDKFGHGTHCAGIIGALGNGVYGISPEVSLMPLKFLNERGLGNFFDGIRAIDYAIEKKVDIISASWGAEISKPELANALKEAGERADQAGVILVAAAGNLNRDNDTRPYFPANANTPSILSVAGTDDFDIKMKISNFGANNVKVAAPGTDILSTAPGGKYVLMSGTSMATPLVAGLAALIKAQKPQLTATQVRDIIVNNGAPAQVEDLCHCRIDAESAMRFTLDHF